MKIAYASLIILLFQCSKENKKYFCEKCDRTILEHSKVFNISISKMNKEDSLNHLYGDCPLRKLDSLFTHVH